VLEWQADSEPQLSVFHAFLELKELEQQLLALSSHLTAVWPLKEKVQVAAVEAQMGHHLALQVSLAVHLQA
jgi:hypothetical protein